MLNNNFAEFIAKRLSQLTGLELQGRVIDESGNNKIVILPSDVHPSKGFRVVLELGWKTIKANFELGNLAGQFVKEMKIAFKENISSFLNILIFLEDEGAELKIFINGNQVALNRPEVWPEAWNGFQITMRSKPVASDYDLIIDPDFFTYLDYWSSLFFSLVLTLLPIDEIEDTIDEGEGVIEGKKIQQIVNKYERSRLNRAICIAIKGTDCSICGFNFSDVYGLIGDGFIHVHHIIALSEVGEDGGFFNPVKDLIPVCPNCHSMIHRRFPPFKPEEIQEMINT